MMGSKVDELGRLSAEIKAAREEFAARYGLKEDIVKDLTEELLAYAKEHTLERLQGVEFVAEVKPTTSKLLSPQKLLGFLKKTGQIARLWELVTIRIADTLALCGEKTLAEDGALEYSTNHYARLVVKEKS
jgi:transcription-repair coupling factor (superfamily II helicase)